MPRKVLHLTYTLDTGGTERVIASYAKHHDTTRYEPVVCSLTGGGMISDSISEMGFAVHHCNKKQGFDTGVLPRLRELLQRERIDIVHVHNPIPNHYAILAIPFSRRRPILRTEHNIFRSGRVMPGYPAVNTVLGLFNRKIIGVSDDVTRSHARKDPLNRRKYVTVHNGIDEEVPAGHREADPRRLLDELAIPAGRKVVGLVANIHEQKAIDLFLESAAIVLKDRPETHFLIVGDGRLMGEMKELSRSLQIDGHVTFAGHREDAVALMRAMDIFSLSSLWEGFPITILEAMRAAVACVVTDVGGNREAVTDGETGYIVPTRRPDLSAERLGRLLDDPERCTKMGKAGRDRFHLLFTGRAMARRTEALYDEILGG